MATKSSESNMVFDILVSLVRDRYSPVEMTHGYVILVSREMPSGNRVILLDRGIDRQYDDRYVTGVQGRSGMYWPEGWESGHYHRDVRDAVKDFVNRCIANGAIS